MFVTDFKITDIQANSIGPEANLYTFKAVINGTGYIKTVRANSESEAWKKLIKILKG